MIGMKRFYVLLLIVMISACGSEHDSNAESIESEQSFQPLSTSIFISAHPQTAKAEVGKKKKLYVSARSSNPNSALVLQSLVPVDQYTEKNCQTNFSYGLNYGIESRETGECRYRYTVEPQSKSYQGRASNLLRVSVSEAASDPLLPILSATSFINVEKVINIKEALGIDWPGDDYSLQENVQGLGLAQVTYDTVNGLITLNSTEVGVTRVLFSLSNGVNTQLGTLDVAFSAGSNRAVTAKHYELPQLIESGSTVQINLTDVGHEHLNLLNDPDGDTLSLSAVQAYDAQVSVTQPTTIAFSSTAAGKQQIAYTVTDGKGGYAVGIISFTVQPDMSLVNQTWDDIYNPDVYVDPDWGIALTYTAPLTGIVAEQLNINYSGTLLENNQDSAIQNAHVVTMTFPQARDYCALRNGRLPTEKEWTNLFKFTGSLSSREGWPVGSSYWSGTPASETTLKAFDAHSGTFTAVNDNQPLFVACILFNDPLIQDYALNLNVVYDLGVVSKVNVTALDPYGEPTPFQRLTFNVDSRFGLFSNGESSIQAHANSVGTYKQDYYDTSLESTVITAQLSDRNKFYVAYDRQDLYENTVMNLSDSGLWQSKQTVKNAKLLIPSVAGLPIRYGYLNITTHLYNSSFSGDGVISHFRIVKSSTVYSGAASFFLEQSSGILDQLVLNYYRGYPTKEERSFLPEKSTYGAVIEYVEENILALKGGEGNGNDIPDEKIDSSSLYVWFYIRGTQLDIYTSETPYRPENPVVSEVINPDNIDFSQPYWIGFSGSNLQSINNSYVTEFNYISYTLPKSE
ncbi:hypothetical protein [Photobacterium sp. 1_MG-2023]|uniref:Ig-like domain-containing protein n=1 Tax=Photobacterium sp. 1_MG-2023 TaxID=3062646 RepID=UPI0026E28F77|nr:hypothetical protein [Photobacterium sp. 1_MG-2023]MDO6708809.1 hypothetical protein [Photobacterium sp. 1_MG-2023]